MRKTTRPAPTPPARELSKRPWTKPFFKDLRLGFEITMYFWTR